MTKLLALFCAILSLQACSKPEQYASGRAGMVAEFRPMAKEPPPPEPSPRGKYLAYEHSVRVDTAEAEVKPLLDKLVAACNADQVNGCVLLASGIQGGRESSAHVRVRIKPAGVEKLVALAASGGELAARDTNAEDLAGPIRDNAKRLAMLRDYQQKLQALEQKASNDAASLIKLSEELSRVQSEVEDASGTDARLMERVNMDLLSIAIQSQAQRTFSSPIKQALAGFGSNLSQGIASAVVGIAYMLPWGVILGILFVVARKVWRRLRRNAKG